MNQHSLFVGIDLSQKKMDISSVFFSGEQAGKPQSYANHLDGAESMSKYLISLLETHKLTRLVVGMEATDLYWCHIYNFLLDNTLLKPFLTFNGNENPQVYVFNPKLIHNFKRIFNEQSKNDKVDSLMIAQRLRFGNLPKNHFADQLYEGLKRLTRYRFHLMDTLCREKNYFLKFLFLKFSSYSQDNPFSDPFGASAGSIAIDFFSVDEIANKPIEELSAFLIKKGKNRFKNPEKIADEIKKLARNSYRLKPSLNEPVNLVLENSLTTIRTLESQVKKMDKAIELELNKIQQPLTSIKGIGSVLAAGIIAEIGNVSNFSNESKLAKYIGLAWKDNQSGSFTAEDTISVKASNKYLKYYMVEAANSLKNHNHIYKTYYLKKLDEVPKHKHKRALVLTARKFTRLVYALLSKNQLFSENYESSKEQKEN